MNLRQILGGAVVAIATAIILRILLPVPVLTGFAVLMFLILLQVLESRFGTGLKTAKERIAAAGRVVAGLTIFIALRFLAGQVLRLYPIDAYNKMAPIGGLKGIFWGRGADFALTWEILFALVAGALVLAWSRGKYRRLVATVFVVSLIVTTLQLVLPRWVNTWPKREEIDNALAEKGLRGYLRGSTTLASPARVVEEKPVVWADPQQIKAPSHKWSDPYPVPSGKFGIAVQKGESVEVRFSDGSSYLLDNYKQITFGKKDGTFRWRGIDREVVVYVYAAT